MDPLNLILLIVVVLIGLKLRSVLGTRNDDEQPGSRANAYRLNRDAFDNQTADRPAPPQEAEQAQELSPPQPAAEEVPPQAAQTAQADMSDEAVEGRGLAYLREVKPQFDEAAFLDGAGKAYEMILTAFANDDLSPVQDFLADDVADGFTAAIAARQDANQRLATQILRLDRPALEDARIENGSVQLDVRFRAEIISFTHAADAPVDEDNLPAPNTVHDVWVFEQPLASRDPNWQLVATQAA